MPPFGLGRKRQTDFERATSAVIEGVRTLLDRERTLDPESMEIFWSTHIGKCAEYFAGMYRAIQTHGVEPLCSGPEVAQELFAMMREIGAVSDALKNAECEQARHDGNALRALVFSNCIGYIAQYNGKIDTISLQWRAYLETLHHLGLVPAVSDEQLPD